MDVAPKVDLGPERIRPGSPGVLGPGDPPPSSRRRERRVVGVLPGEELRMHGLEGPNGGHRPPAQTPLCL